MAWSVRVGTKWKGCYRDAGCKQRSRTFDTKRDAMAWATEQEAALRKGDWLDPSGAKVGFADWAERWLAERTDLKPKTVESYESLMRTLILPKFEGHQLGRIDQLAVRGWVSEMAQRLSPSRTRQAFHLFGAIMKAAVDSGKLPRTPCGGISLPRLPPSATTALTAQEVARLGDASDARLRALVYVLAYGGLRLGEALALRRRSFDGLHNRLYVTGSLAEVGGRLIFGDTKTHQRRTVGLGKAAMIVLGDHLDAYTGPELDALIFTAPEGGPVRQSNLRLRYWQKAVTAAGLPEGTRIHDLRHTCASLLIQSGAHPKQIQAHLGHSSIEVTMDRYGHLFPDAEAALGARLDLIFEQARDDAAASVLPKAVGATEGGRSETAK